MPDASFTVRDAFHEVLRTHGLTTLFGNPGSTEMSFFADWPEHMRYVMSLQEASAVAMADGFAQVTGNAALVSLHSAAGVGHALGSVFTAWRNQTPVIIMAGQQSRALFQTEPFLFADQASEFPKPYVKWSCEPARAEDVPAALSRAYHLAMQYPRGPVFLSVPADDWDVPAGPLPERRVHGRPAADLQALQELAAALDSSRNPALIAGPAIDRDGAWHDTVALAGKLGCSVYASPRSHRASFPEDHPLFSGFLPFSRRRLAEALDGHDLILVIGAPVFTYHIHEEGPYLPAGCRLWQLTDDPDQAARAVTGTSVIGYVPAAVRQLLELTTPRGQAASPGWPRPLPVTAAPGEPLTAEFVLQALARQLPEGTVIVEEAPSHRRAQQQFLPMRQPGSLYTAASGGLGWSMPAAVGIALADPSRPVLCLIGDGGAMYSPQAIWTAVQQNVPVTFLILNNAGYGSMKGFAALHGVSTAPSFDLPSLDLAVLARGMGCEAYHVTTPDELLARLAVVGKRDQPLLLDVQLGTEAPEFA